MKPLDPRPVLRKIDVMIDGRRCQGAFAVSGSTTWFSLDGEAWTVESELSVRSGARSSKVSAQDPSRISAPMPGKIIKVFVGAGDPVEIGQTLVVMEAMKMEYTLKAAARGKVQSVHSVAGEQVALGVLLVQLEVSL